MSDENADLYWCQFIFCICLKMSVWCSSHHQSNLTVILNWLKWVTSTVLLHSLSAPDGTHHDTNVPPQNTGTDFDCKVFGYKGHMHACLNHDALIQYNVIHKNTVHLIDFNRAKLDSNHCFSGCKSNKVAVLHCCANLWMDF